MISQRVAIVGPECSGKTTLAQALATEYETYWVPEYWRFYWDAKRFAKDDPVWTTDEFVHVAGQQNRLEDTYALRARDILFCDTTSFQTSIWHRRYLGFYAEALDAAWVGRRYELIFVCTPDMPFVQDGVRDGESIRLEMCEWIESRLQEHALSYTRLAGDIQQRLQLAKLAIHAQLSR